MKASNNYISTTHHSKHIIYKPEQSLIVIEMRQEDNLYRQLYS